VTAVLHVVDAGCDETQLQVLATLRSRLQADGHRHAVCAIDPDSDDRANQHGGGDVLRTVQRLWNAMNYAPRLPSVAEEFAADIVHAWGARAAAVCCARLPSLPLIVSLLSPDQARDLARSIRSLPADATVVVGSQVARSRLVTAGVPSDRVVVIRGPADFSTINKARASNMRKTVVGDARPVVLLAGPPSRGGGQYFGLWAAAIVRQIVPTLRVLMPYESREAQRLKRFVKQIRMSEMLIVPDPALTWPQLVTCADVFLCPAHDEISTEPIATAMAAGLVVVGTAVRSIAELIADKSNGLLCKANDPRALAGRLLTALEDGDLVRRITEVARGQAYEVFGVRTFADNYARVYENVLANRLVGDGVHDAAYVPA
jgi:glycosyltransferase involved in cell wall biosynthesis